jgi:hypothetical protein
MRMVMKYPESFISSSLFFTYKMFSNVVSLEQKRKSFPIGQGFYLRRGTWFYRITLWDKLNKFIKRGK